MRVTPVPATLSRPLSHALSKPPAIIPAQAGIQGYETGVCLFKKTAFASIDLKDGTDV